MKLIFLYYTINKIWLKVQILIFTNYSPNLNSISNKYKTQSPNQQELDDQFKTINYSITPNLNDEKSKFSTNDNLYLNNNYNSIDSNQGFYHTNQAKIALMKI